MRSAVVALFAHAAPGWYRSTDAPPDHIPFIKVEPILNVDFGDQAAIGVPASVA